MNRKRFAAVVLSSSLSAFAWAGVDEGAMNPGQALQQAHGNLQDVDKYQQREKNSPARSL